MLDPLRVFLQDLGRCRPLSADETRRLGARRRDAGDREARAALIESVMPWAVEIARRYNHRGVALEDLVSLAMEGVVQAVDCYDPDRALLTTHVVWHVRQKIRRYLAEQTYPIRLPSYVTYSPRVPARTRLQAAAVRRIGSLDAPAAEEERETPGGRLADRGLSPDAASIEAEQPAEREARARRLRQHIAELPGHGPVVMTGVLEGKTLKAIGDTLGLSRERIRQIKLKAFSLLRKRLGGDGVRG